MSYRKTKDNMKNLVLLLLLLIAFSGCSTRCNYDYGKCEQKIDTKNPIVTFIRIINGGVQYK